MYGLCFLKREPGSVSPRPWGRRGAEGGRAVARRQRGADSCAASGRCAAAEGLPAYLRGASRGTQQIPGLPRPT